jgi:hypothetical protein
MNPLPYVVFGGYTDEFNSVAGLLVQVIWSVFLASIRLPAISFVLFPFALQTSAHFVV